MRRGGGPSWTFSPKRRAKRCSKPPRKWIRTCGANAIHGKARRFDTRLKWTTITPSSQISSPSFPIPPGHPRLLHPAILAFFTPPSPPSSPRYPRLLHPAILTFFTPPSSPSSPRHPRLLPPLFLPSPPRHSRESGNPESPPPEIKYKSQPADPFSLYGLTGVGLAFRRSGGHRNLGDMGKSRTKSAIRNQVQIAVSGSLLPLWEKARMRVRRALARLCGRDARAPRRKPTPVSPLWEKARMRVRRAQARLRGRDARAPRGANLSRQV